MRHRGFNPFPWRCAAGLRHDSYYFARMPLEEAVECYWLVSEWDFAIQLKLGAGADIPFAATLVLSRPETVELAIALSSKATWTGRWESANAGSYIDVALVFGSTDPRQDGTAFEQAYWSGRHVRRRRRDVEPGFVTPGVLVKVTGFLDFGSEFSVALDNLPKDVAVTVTGQMDGHAFQVYGATDDVVSGSVVISRRTSFLYDGSDLKPVYTPNFVELRNPLLARVP